MLEALGAIQRHTSGHSFEAFAADEVLTAAILYHFMILGEAATQIPQDVQDQSPLAAWPKIRGMRNRLMHAYFQTDLRIVWDTAIVELPALKAELERLLNEGGPPHSPTSYLQ